MMFFRLPSLRALLVCLLTLFSIALPASLVWAQQQPSFIRPRTQQLNRAAQQSNPHKAEAQKSATEQTEPQRPAAEQPESQKPNAQPADRRQPAAEQSDADTPAAEQPDGQKPAIEQPQAEQQVAQQPESKKADAQSADAQWSAAHEADPHWSGAHQTDPQWLAEHQPDPQQSAEQQQKAEALASGQPEPQKAEVREAGAEKPALEQPEPRQLTAQESESQKPEAPQAEPQSPVAQEPHPQEPVGEQGQLQQPQPADPQRPAEEQAQAEQHPPALKPEPQKADGQQPETQLPAQQPDAQKPADEQAQPQQVAEQPESPKPDAQQPERQGPVAPQPDNQKPAEDQAQPKLVAQQPEAQKPEVQEPEPQKPAAPQPDQKPAEDQAQPQQPPAQQPEDQKADAQQPEPKKPAEEQARPQQSQPQQPETQKPEAQQPEPQKPAAPQPDAQKPAEDQAQPQQPPAQQPEGQKSDAQQPEPKKPAEEQAQPQQPEAQKPAAPQTGEQKPAEEQAQPQQSPAQQPESQKPAAPQPDTQKPAAEQAQPQQPEAQKPPAQQPEQPKQTPQQPKAPNPFETVPQETQPAKPEQPAPKPPATQEPAKPPAAQPEAAQPATPGAPPENIVEAVEFRGSRRVPQDTLRAQIFTKRGDKFDEDVLRRDFMALWNTGRFDDIKLEREPGKTGWIVRFVLTERPVVRSIKYEGNKSITMSEILDRYKERKVGLTTESQYDPNKVQRAKVVLTEYEAERGRQFATVTPEIRQLPPSSLEITFRIDEGPKVKVGNIDIEGNEAFSYKAVRRAMKNLRPVGIPYSIFFENLFAKTYDSTKLEEDMERIRQFYMEHGYFMAKVTDHDVKVRDVGGSGFKIPLFYPNKPGKRADIAVTVEEGRLYHLRNISFSGVKLFRTPETLMKPLFQMQSGDVFSTAKLKKGLENMRKLYGEFGYIDMVAEPNFDVIPNTDKVDLALSVDEGKQFFVRRIDFSGNTTTRDKVIRRELLIDEGDMFNSRLWEMSILRLNQLGYFDVLKEGEAADIKRDTKTNTVDITLKVKERGKNSIQLNGGVSGIAGTFIGFSYATNNFLGLGETLSLSAQLGDRIRQVELGFTEPYFLDRPLQVGFTVFLQRFNYNQGVEVSLLSGRNLIPLFNQLGSQNLLNYVSNGIGFTTFATYPLRRSFARVGLTYGYNVQNLTPLTPAATTYFTYLDFQSVGGPNSLTGIKTSQITPSYTYNTVNHPITPTGGKSLSVSLPFAGSILGGNVNTINPTIDAKYFHRAPHFKNHIIGAHVLARLMTGYGGKVAPPYSRFYMGGENDIRGFEIWSISPLGYIPSTTNVNVLNNDGSIRQQRIVNSNGTISTVNVSQQIPIYQFIYPGGDTQVVTNFEYRIPIFGPVVLALFGDAGIDKLLLPDQLRLNPERVAQLNGLFPQANFQGRAYIVPESEKLRASTGIELQVMMPVVNAPFRLYWAYNPSTLSTVLRPPVVADRSYFANQATFASALAQFGTPIPYVEKKSMFRFSIGRTF
jgi:outer membrane protein insertion porin family